MGVRNYLIEGVSGTGKTTVATELQQRGYHVIHGDRELAYRGDPRTGEPLIGFRHEQEDVAFVHRQHLWHVGKVRSLAADKSHPVSFFCGGSRNSHHFIDLFDAVFVLEIDRETLENRLQAGPKTSLAEGRPSGTLSCTCMRRGKTFRRMRLPSTPLGRSPQSSTISCRNAGGPAEAGLAAL